MKYLLIRTVPDAVIKEHPLMLKGKPDLYLTEDEHNDFTQAISC